MQRNARLPFLKALPFLLLFGFMANSSPAGPPQTPAWKAVEKAINEGLPKTAAKQLGKIATEARVSGRDAEFVRARVYEIVLLSSIENAPLEKRIDSLRTAIEKEQGPRRAVMQAILAQWFWAYYQQNRWQYMNRTNVQDSGELGNDIATWDLASILKAIDTEFQTALTEAESLKAIPTSQYSSLLEPNNVPDTFTPTMYDVVARSALQFYQAGEQAVSSTADAWEPDAASEILSDTDSFVAWKIDTDQSIPVARATKLFQQWIGFRSKRPTSETSALIAAEVERVEFAESYSTGSTKVERVLAAFANLSNRFSEDPESTLADYELAKRIDNQGNRVKARRLALAGAQRHPKSIGGQRCQSLVDQIERKECRLITDQVWNAQGKRIALSYRNVDRVYFRLVVDDGSFAKGKWQERIRTATPIRSWQSELPPTDDFQTKVKTLNVDQEIPFGNYFIVTGHREDFALTDNQIQWTRIIRSDLAMMTRTHNNRHTIEAIVTDGWTGHPIEDAKVTFSVQNRRGENTPSQQLATDTDGIARFEPIPNQEPNRRSLSVRTSVEHGRDSLKSGHQDRSYRYDRNRDAVHQAVLFTDRAIYRPGQTIFFKAVVTRIDQKAEQYSVAADQRYSVALFDRNGQEVEKLALRSNKFGSVSGRFTAPRGALNGSMSLRFIEGANGQSSVRVEEYKRPKFRVELSPPVEAALDQDVTVGGSAAAYNGFPVAGATVKYRVIRHTQFPRWCWWYRPAPPTEIIAGTLESDVDGKFDVTFDAKPPAGADSQSGVSYRFEITADVTDTTGETRSDSQSVRVGFRSLQAILDVDEFLTTDEPIRWDIRTETLDGESLATTGTIEIFTVKQPPRPLRSSLIPAPQNNNEGRPPADFSRDTPSTWPVGERVSVLDFETDGTGNTTVASPLGAGLYRTVLTTQDKNEREVKTETTFSVIDPGANRFAIQIPQQLAGPTREYQPDETATLVWSSGFDDARAYVEVVRDHKVLKAYWTPEGSNQHRIDVPIADSMLGGITVRTNMVHDGQWHSDSRRINVPWKSKQLDITTERFVSKLKPGGEEKITLKIRGKDAQAAAAEVVATMYDASLDAYAKLSWINRFGFFRSESSYVQTHFHNTMTGGNIGWNDWQKGSRYVSIPYPGFPPELVHSWFGGGPMRAFGKRSRISRGRAMEGMAMAMGAPAPAAVMAGDAVMQDSVAGSSDSEFVQAEIANKSDAEANEAADSDPPPRTNLNETAFFFPSVQSDDDGLVTIEFTMPEALTQWRMMAFAHDTQLRSGTAEAFAVTSKDLMVDPNPPRFLRAGDKIEFTAKVSNASNTSQNGSVTLAMRDPFSGKDISSLLSIDTGGQSFQLPAGRSETFAWKILVPDGIDAVVYRVIARSERASDGEEADLPVLPRKILVTESIQMPIRDAGDSQFEMKSLLGSKDSTTIDHRLLELQVVSNPAWYVVESLPTMIEYPHGCAEQTFNRIYAGLIAGHLVQSDPRIAETIKQWREHDQLESPLLENEDLRSVLIEETPWVGQAQSESQSRKQLADLFEANRLKDTISLATARLDQMQLGDGGWPWFPGGDRNPYITLYITTGFGRLRHMGVDVDVTPAIKSIRGLDTWMHQRYEKIKPVHRDKSHLDSTAALYLYCRSFFSKDVAHDPAHQVSWNYWTSQAKEHWVKMGIRQSQAHIAVAMKRMGDRTTANKIMASIMERSVRSEEMGLHWNDGRSWWWYHAPIETQAMMIEAIDEVTGDAAAVEDAKVWLIKQKQTQSWPTTKSTADAVYAVLMRGTNLLASREIVTATLGGKPVVPSNLESGTGFYTERMTGAEIDSTMGSVTLTKKDAGVAWAGLHWQYLEDIAKVPATEGTPLSIEKRLFVKTLKPTGKQLIPFEGGVGIGDELVVRLIVRTDRDMEFVHIKDHRGSGTEPLDVLSGYQWSDGLRYYQTTGDTATHFFIDRLPKGTYVLEYSTRIQLRGRYQTGLANIQCMYAPEFSAHSETIALEVGNRER